MNGNSESRILKEDEKWVEGEKCPECGGRLISKNILICCEYVQWLPWGNPKCNYVLCSG